MWFGDPDFDKAFWPGFFGNLLADFLVAIVIVWLLATLGKIFKSADGEVRLKVLKEQIFEDYAKVDLLVGIEKYR